MHESQTENQENAAYSELNLHVPEVRFFKTSYRVCSLHFLFDRKQPLVGRPTTRAQRLAISVTPTAMATKNWVININLKED